jgi:glycosyltransferase involved in cell wall biosynthesis
MMRPLISVVISTYNRQDSLRHAIESILAQKRAPEYELIVVDNRSTDKTALLIEEYTACSPRVRYVYEACQGVSYGRNTGIAQAAADIIAFTDDDIIVAENWLSAIHATFEEQPQFGCVGGKVLPRWPEAPPSWITKRHWGPLALLDYGEAQMVDAQNPKCLITANMAIRRQAFTEIGYFRPAFQKTAGSTCSIEDRELQERYWAAGGRCWFNPEIVVYAEVQRFRLEKEYHRRWHFRFGELQALLREPEFERSGWHVFDVPGHVVRRLATHGVALVSETVRGCKDNAFEHELEARFYAGFLKSRWGSLLSKNDA